MSDTEIAFRYARALFALGRHSASTESWKTTFGEIVSIFAKEVQFRTLCAAPQLDLKIKTELIKRAFASCSEQTLTHFLLLLLKKRRLQLLPKIYAAYVQLVDKAAQRIPVRFITACPIEEGTAQRLKLSLESKLQKKVYIEHEINPALIAGGMVVIGNKRLDASLQGKLLRLKKHLLDKARGTHEVKRGRSRLGD